MRDNFLQALDAERSRAATSGCVFAHLPLRTETVDGEL
jgi:hypothetical protein